MKVSGETVRRAALAKYSGNNKAERLFVQGEGGTLQGIGYGTGVFYDERHTKNRYGVEYVYHNADKDTWADYARLSYDRQGIDLDNRLQQTHCSHDGSDKNCRPDGNKPYSFYKSDRMIYEESRTCSKQYLKRH